jgi:hypothetical protein
MRRSRMFWVWSAGKESLGRYGGQLLETHWRYVLAELRSANHSDNRCICHPSGTNATRETRDPFERYSYSPIPSNLDLCRVRTKELYIRILMVQQRNDQAPCLWPLLELEKFVLEAFQVIRRCGGRRGSICLFDELQNVDKVGASDKD